MTTQTYLGNTGHINGVDRMVLDLASKSLVDGSSMKLTLKNNGADCTYTATQRLVLGQFHETTVKKDGKILFIETYHDETDTSVVRVMNEVLQ